MSKLNNLQLQELTIEEQVNIDGGILPVIAVGLAVLFVAGQTAAMMSGKKMNGMP